MIKTLTTISIFLFISFVYMLCGRHDAEVETELLKKDAIKHKVALYDADSSFFRWRTPEELRDVFCPKKPSLQFERLDIIDPLPLPSIDLSPEVKVAKRK